MNWTLPAQQQQVTVRHSKKKLKVLCDGAVIRAGAGGCREAG